MGAVRLCDDDDDDDDDDDGAGGAGEGAGTLFILDIFCKLRRSANEFIYIIYKYLLSSII